MADPIFFTSKTELRDWFENNSAATEMWVGYYKKGTDKPTISWSHSVDVALCFGWIDGIRKSIDDESYKIRFTPRNPKSVWSEVNVKKVKALIESGDMREEGLRLFNVRQDKKGYSTSNRDAKLPAEYEVKLKANPKAWRGFCSLAPSYQRNAIWWVTTAKREETRQKRLNVLIESSAEGLKVPHMRG